VIDIETRVVESMRTRAEAAPPTGDLHERVIGRAAGVRRRRLLLRVAGAAAVVVAVAAALPATPLFADRGRVPEGVAAPATTSPPKLARSPGPTTLPEIVGAATASEQPGAIGTDPLMLHFDVYLASVNITASVWTSGRGIETVSTPYDKEGRFIEAVIGTDPAVVDVRRMPVGNAWMLPDGTLKPAFTETVVATLTVAGRPATLFSVTNDPLDGARPAGATGFTMSNPDHEQSALVLRWQPADGVHALVQARGYDRSLVERVAGALRLDHAQRCATPLRFTPPAGGTLTSCRTSVRARPVGPAGVWLDSSYEYALPGGTMARVWTEVKPDRVAHDLNQFHATHTINGAKAQWRTDDPAGLWLLSYGPAPAEVFISGLGESESVALVQGMTFGPDLADVTTWPAGPTG
jgi:hypothetical protein